MAEATQTTAPMAPAKAEERETIAQKVENLQARKTQATSEMNAEGATDAQKTAIQEEIAVIDRKLRWYAGRSGEGKAAKAGRPSKSGSTKGSSRRKSAAPETAPVSPPAPAAPAANES